MTVNPKSISIRQCLQRLNLASEDDLRSRILEVPAFLNAWAEFRDDFLWGCPEGLSGHVYLKVVVPATLRELSDSNPTGFYIYRTVSGPASYATPFAKVDKTHFILSDHYIRLLLQTLPSLSRAPEGIFCGKMDTDTGREACVDALAYTIHALRNQYRPDKKGNMSRWLERNVPESRHVDKAREFDNPRYSAMRAQTVDVSKQEEDLDGGAAAAKEGEEKSHGRSDSATSRNGKGHDVGKHVVTSLASPGFSFTPWPHPPPGVLPPRPTFPPASSVEGKGISPPAWQLPRLIPPAADRAQPNQLQQQRHHQRQQDQHHQHQKHQKHQKHQNQSQNQNQSQSQSQHHQRQQQQQHHQQQEHQLGDKQRLNGQSLSHTSKSSASTSPTTPSLSAINKPTTPTVMGISNRSLKRTRSASSLNAAHNSPDPKIARTDLPAATTTKDKAGALNTEVKQEPDTATEQNPIILLTSLSLSSENDVNEGIDQANMMQEGNEQHMTPHTLILLEQVRVARRGYAKAEAELAIEDDIIANAGAAAMVEAGQEGWRDWVAKKAEMEVWRKRCENILRELRGVADVNELESVWAGLEEAKRL